MRGLLILLALLALSAKADEPSANAKETVTPAWSGPYENTPVKIAARPASQPAGVASNSSSAGWDYARIPIALAGVLLLIFAMRWLGKGLAEKTTNKNAGRGVQVLSRSVVSPRQQMLVVQFGRKLVLVGNSGAEMTPLCQLTDPEEVAEVLAQIGTAKNDKGFKLAFTGAEKSFEARERRVEPVGPEVLPEEQSAAPEPDSTEDLTGLMARIRRMNEQFQQT